MSDRSALKLYDCLVPKVKELSLRCERCRSMQEEGGVIEPQASEDDVYALLTYHKMSSIITENKNLRELCDKLKETNANQFSLVDWYIKFLEKGLNAKDMIKDLLEL